MNEEEIYKKAEKRARDKVDFIIHLIIYIVVNSGLITINLLTSRDSLWVLFPIIGWGIGLFAHFLNVFTFKGLYDRMIQREVAKERGKQK